MRKGAKNMIGSEAGHKSAVAEIHNDAVMADSLEASTQVFPPLGPHQSQPRVDEEAAKPEKEDEAKDASSCQQQEKEEVNDDKKKRGGKRKRATNKEAGKKQAPRAKKARATKPEEEPEYLEDKRNLQDLWKTASPVGIEWGLLDALYEHNWDFKHLEEALEEGGMLYGKKVFVFVNAEPQFVLYKDVNKVVPVPTVVVIESVFPPSDKIAITSIQRASKAIIPMKHMKMDWVPYIPLEKRSRQVDRMEFQIFILVCTQRRAALKHLKDERLRKFDYCLPYFYDPLKEDELEESSEVQILFPSEPPVVCEFDWRFDRLEVFVNNLIREEELSAEQKDEFKAYVKEHVRAAKKARLDAIAARIRAIEEMSQEAWEAFESMKLYKFYPQHSPDVSGIKKSPIINRYYGDADQVL